MIGLPNLQVLRSRRVRAILAREWSETVRHRGFLVASLLIPIMMAGMVVLPGLLLQADQAERSVAHDALQAALVSRYATALVLVLFLFLGITSQSQALLRSVMEERGNRMMEVLLSSVEPLELLLGKLLGYAAVAATQLALWAAVTLLLVGTRGTPFVFRMPDALGWPLLALFGASYAVGYLLYASIYAAVGAVVATEREAIILQQLLALALVAPFVIAAALVVRPDDPLAARLTWVPLLAPTLVVVRAAFAPVATTEVVGALGLTALTALAMLAVAARLFRGPALLSARRLPWREAWRTAQGSSTSSNRSHRL